MIEQDAYYRDISNIPMEDRHLHNFDHPDAIDIELFNQQLISLIKGQIVEVPIYDFSTHSRLKDTKTVHPHRVIIVEGILTLHYTILRMIRNKLDIYTLLIKNSRLFQLLELMEKD